MRVSWACRAEIWSLDRAFWWESSETESEVTEGVREGGEDMKLSVYVESRLDAWSVSVS